MLLVVCDTSPLNYLAMVRHDHVLPALFARVLVPPAVLAELRHEGAPVAVRDWADAPPRWLEVRAPVAIHSGLTLGPGETEAISLAREQNATAVLIDERRAAAVAGRLGLFVIGTLGVLEAAAARRLIRLPDGAPSNLLPLHRAALSRGARTTRHLPAPLIGRVLLRPGGRVWRGAKQRWMSAWAAICAAR